MPSLCEDTGNDGEEGEGDEEDWVAVGSEHSDGGAVVGAVAWGNKLLSKRGLVGQNALAVSMH